MGQRMHTNQRLPRLTAEEAWQQAWLWLCLRRRHHPANADIWHLRFHWSRLGPLLWQKLQAGTYRLQPMQRLGQYAVWSAPDALVLKWVALMAGPQLPWHPRCEHGAGMGVVASRRRLMDAIEEGGYRFVMRTDIRGYYQHIGRADVEREVIAHVRCPLLRVLIGQYLAYSVEAGGEFHTPERGIPRGCALSPLIGASLLYRLDAELGECGYYARYMDDFIILARQRWPLRRAIARLRACLAAMGFELHPDKTRIGRLARGVDWLGGWFNQQGRVGIAPRALQQYRTRSLRLYEQTWRSTRNIAECEGRVRLYRERWGRSFR
ncbi:reverse transcriptase domain-containing protein [Aeromonas veronii]|uniref:reverse transcriptase domain-containing protein n=1 Tax=Aeromonas veronii TaxID=654 RepID=UPI001EFF0593|nr:reverse transcriptase domain-containing protein [Aeromonas veronii]